MNCSVSFLVEARANKKAFAPINVNINFAGDTLRYFTGYKLSTDNWTPIPGARERNQLRRVKALEGQIEKEWIFDNWDIDTQRLPAESIAYQGKRKITAKALNKKLDKVNGNIDEIFTGIGKPSRETIVQYLNDILEKSERKRTQSDSDPNGEQRDTSFWGMYETYVNEAKVSPGRRKQLKVTKKHLERFDPSLTFDKVTPDTLRRFERFLLTDKEPKSRNTVAGQIKKLRAFWNWSRLEMPRLHYPFNNYKIDAEEYGEPIFITKAEIDTLYNAKLTDERLMKIRDIFVFQCLIGCRVGDLVNLTKNNIIDDCIVYVPRKTKDDKPVTVTVPLTTKAKEILSRYSLPGDMLLPFISPQKYNDGIKDVFKNDKVNLTRTVIRLNPLTRREESVKLCDIASSHLGRRSFIGNLFGRTDTSIITSMTGHVKDSKAFGRYYSVTDELKRNALKNLE